MEQLCDIGTGVSVQPASRSFARWRHVAALVLLLLTACAGGWHQAKVAPEKFIAEEEPHTVRVTTKSGDIFDLFGDPWIENDTLFGMAHELVRGEPHAHRVGIPLSDIRELAGYKTPLGLQVGMLALGLGALFMTGVMLFIVTHPFGPGG